MTLSKTAKKPILILSIFSTFLLMFIYCFQMGAMSRNMNNIALAQKRIHNLIKENEKLEFSIMRNNSALTIDSLAHNFEFEKIVKVQYLHTSENIMAAK